MKKILSTILSLILIFSLTACSTPNNTTSKFETNSSQSESIVSKEDNLNASKVTVDTNTSSNNNTLSSKPITSQNTSKPQQCSHYYKNVITSPTCTKRGYTTHICTKCNYSFVDNYVAAGHKYSNYKCTKCGMLDKTHTYDIFVDWILENGTTNGEECSMRYETGYGDTITITYYHNKKTVLLSHSQTEYSEGYKYFWHTCIIIDKISHSYYYSSSLENKTFGAYSHKISGYINAKKYTSNSPLTYTDYKSDIGDEDYKSALDLATGFVTLILMHTTFALKGEVDNYSNSGLTISDLGFKSYKLE